MSDFHPGDIGRIMQKITAASERAAHVAAEYLLTEANKTVPIRSGDLLRSGAVSDQPGSAKSAVSYNTPYAVRQHEELDYRHAEGRRAKWLELTFLEESDQVARICAGVMRGSL